MQSDTSPDQHTDTMSPRERVLQAAELCFMARGYAAVTLRDIAAEVGIKHTSLYHHVPGGKEELFVEVVERSLARHRRGIRESIDRVEPTLRARLHAISDWFLSQSPMDLVRMTQSDMPALRPDLAERLVTMTYETLLRPVEQVLVDAAAAGEMRDGDLGLVAGGLVGMIQSLFSVPGHAIQGSRSEMGRKLIDIVLDGISTGHDQREA